MSVGLIVRPGQDEEKPPVTAYYVRKRAEGGRRYAHCEATYKGKHIVVEVPVGKDSDWVAMKLAFDECCKKLRALWQDIVP